ncbi:MAG: hypothetical protein IPK81_22175 [Rhodospirillales bacterium]|nr:MAG: hypothetical protein IPK81_22175 [Rhodospirillales bacterium]
MWLRKQLHAMYDEVAKEPLPADLLKLIDDDAGAAKKGDGSAGDSASPDPRPRKD